MNALLRLSAVEISLEKLSFSQQILQTHTPYICTVDTRVGGRKWVFWRTFGTIWIFAEQPKFDFSTFFRRETKVNFRKNLKSSFSASQLYHTSLGGEWGKRAKSAKEKKRF